MAEAEDIGNQRFWRFMRITALGLGLVFLLGIGAGFIAAHVDHAKALSLAGTLALGAIVLAFAACAWLLVREVRKPTGEEPLTRKERLNRNILVGCGLLGLLMGIGMTVAGGDVAKSGYLFSNEPLSPVLALALVAVTGVLLPIVSIFWHRSAVDELETEAYKTGALYAIYVYMTGAPVWWLLWRGGFAPAPDGIIIYFAVILTLGAVWLRRKHG